MGIKKSGGGLKCTNRDHPFSHAARLRGSADSRTAPLSRPIRRFRDSLSTFLPSFLANVQCGRATFVAQPPSFLEITILMFRDDRSLLPLLFSPYTQLPIYTLSPYSQLKTLFTGLPMPPKRRTPDVELFALFAPLVMMFAQPIVDEKPRELREQTLAELCGIVIVPNSNINISWLNIRVKHTELSSSPLQLLPFSIKED